MENYVIFAPNIENVEAFSNKEDRSKTKLRKMHNSQQRFELLYAQNFQKVVSYAKNYLDNSSDAENIAQDVFIALWEKFDNIDDNNIVAYIYTATRNKCLNFLRNKKVLEKYAKSSYKEKIAYLNYLAIENDNQLNIFEKEVQEIVNRGLDKMSKKVRRTFLLSRQKGLKNREIAVMEDIVEGTVESRISNAFMILRKLLRDYLQ